MTNLFFVYGTLKKGYGNNNLLGKSYYLGKGLTSSKYTVYNSGFPLAKYNEEGNSLLGEVYRVEEQEVVRQLDQLEGNGSFYTRVVRPVVILDFFEEEVSAWIYEIERGSDYGASYCKINPEFNAYEWKR